jgi:hypothetical protein
MNRSLLVKIELWALGIMLTAFTLTNLWLWANALEPGFSDSRLSSKMDQIQRDLRPFA